MHELYSTPARRWSPGAKLAERRTAIEIQICVERMQAAGGALRWCNSHQQLADGMTKASARTKLAHELQRGVHCLRYDPEYTASKKVKHEDKEMEQDALNKAAEEYEVQRRVNEGIYTIADMETEEKEECKMCLLRGCGLPVEEGRKYCSKRHYHAAQGQAAKVAKEGSGRCCLDADFCRRRRRGWGVRRHNVWLRPGVCHGLCRCFLRWLLHDDWLLRWSTSWMARWSLPSEEHFVRLRW